MWAPLSSCTRNKRLDCCPWIRETLLLYVCMSLSLPVFICMLQMQLHTSGSMLAEYSSLYLLMVVKDTRQVTSLTLQTSTPVKPLGSEHGVFCVPVPFICTPRASCQEDSRFISEIKCLRFTRCCVAEWWRDGTLGQGVVDMYKLWFRQ